MIANFPTDKHDGQQLTFDLERIRKECPTFTAWLAACEAETVEAVCRTDGAFLMRQTGALDTLRQISGIIANPPKPEATANATASGMAV